MTLNTASKQCHANPSQMLCKIFMMSYQPVGVIRNSMEDSTELDKELPPVEPSASEAGQDGCHGTEGLMSRSFLSLTVAQALGAMNDNTYRWFLIAIGKQMISGSQVRLFGGWCLFLPFILFVAPAGYFSDRFSKRSVIVSCKFAEIVIMAAAVLSIVSGNIYIMLVVLFVMGSQSAMFGPAKYGSIPELVRRDRVPAANGILAMTTMIAIIIGTLLGNYLGGWTTAPEVQQIASSMAEENIAQGLDAESVILTSKELGSLPRPGQYRWGFAILVLVGTATLGWIAALFMHKLPVAAPKRKFPWNPFSQAYRDIRLLIGYPALFLVALGNVYYWSLGVMSQGNIDKYARVGLNVPQERVAPLLGILVLGIGIGAILAGWLSKGRVELGLVAFGALGIIVITAALFFIPLPEAGVQATMTIYIVAAICLAFLGVSAGLFDIPLLAFLQEESPHESRGRILAANNFLAFSGMMLASGLFFVLEGGSAPAGGKSSGEIGGFAQIIYWILDHIPTFGLSAQQIWLFATLATIPVLIAIAYFTVAPICTVFARAMKGVVYRPRVFGLESIPDSGALIVSNHVSWIDGFMLGLITPDWVRFFADKKFADIPIGRSLSKHYKVIYVEPGKRSVVKAVREAQQALRDGDLVGVFAEGAISRSRQIRHFEPGYLTIWRGANGLKSSRKSNTDSDDETPDHPTPTIPIIPVYIGGMWGSLFTHSGGRCFKKRPRLLPDRVTFAFGRPIFEPIAPQKLREVIMEMGVDAMRNASSDPADFPEFAAPSVNEDVQLDAIESEAPDEISVPPKKTVYSRGQKMIPARAFLRMCRRNKGRLHTADTTGVELKGGDLLLRSLIFRRLLRREVLTADETHVGILLPPTAVGALANAALGLDGRIAVNLNYTMSSEIMNHCIEHAGIKHVLTSRKVMEKLNLELDAEIIYLDDFKEKVTLVDKLTSLVAAKATPITILERMLGLTKISPDDVLTLIFTSGSTGRPKAAMLTHENIRSNVESFCDAEHITKDDKLVGILPFFHAFGYTVTLWAPLMHDCMGLYHTSPLEAKPLGKLIDKYKATVLVAAPTFLRSWLKRAKPEHWQTLDLLITGAEKLPPDLADTFEEKFGVRPWEGYGATETSPAVAANIPPNRCFKFQDPGRMGSVGQPLPGIAAKIVDMETGKDLPTNERGMLLVKGPNIMKGYYKDPEKTAKVLRDGWYVTGDVAMIDDEGFIFITGRESRMSKIAGEMVPHVLVEEAIAQAMHATEASSEKTEEKSDEEGGDSYQVAIVGLPDPRKGEKIVVLHIATSLTPVQICDALKEEGLPPLWVPSPKNFRQVDSIPVLGTGKMDLRGIRDQAEQLFPKEGN
jgi:acyl-[acyl-carrier-protein]-phospholipid O-acyltransferase / long-chain-fatty-acid--[acyl-carrier-protein] ligase